jgi:hypothetical protein
MGIINVITSLVRQIALCAAADKLFHFHSITLMECKLQILVHFYKDSSGWNRPNNSSLSVPVLLPTRTSSKSYHTGTHRQTSLMVVKLIVDRWNSSLSPQCLPQNHARSVGPMCLFICQDHAVGETISRRILTSEGWFNPGYFILPYITRTDASGPSEVVVLPCIPVPLTC